MDGTCGGGTGRVFWCLLCSKQSDSSVVQTFSSVGRRRVNQTRHPGSQVTSEQTVRTLQEQFNYSWEGFAMMVHTRHARETGARGRAILYVLGVGFIITWAGGGFFPPHLNKSLEARI